MIKLFFLVIVFVSSNFFILVYFRSRTRVSLYQNEHKIHQHKNIIYSIMLIIV